MRQNGNFGRARFPERKQNLTIADIMDMVQPPNSTLTDYINEVKYQNELERRDLFLIGEVSFVSAWDVCEQIRTFNRDDELKQIPIEERKPIYISIFSGGGDVCSGNMLLDFILQSKTPVYTVNIGIAASMAGLLFIAGHKRLSLQHATLMLHAGSLSLDSDVSKAEDFMDYNKKAKLHEDDFLLSHSKVKPETLKEHARDDWYIFATEAQELGFVDFIVGDDCELKDSFPIYSLDETAVLNGAIYKNRDTGCSCRLCACERNEYDCPCDLDCDECPYGCD